MAINTNYTYSSDISTYQPLFYTNDFKISAVGTNIGEIRIYVTGTPKFSRILSFPVKTGASTEDVLVEIMKQMQTLLNDIRKQAENYDIDVAKAKDAQAKSYTGAMMHGYKAYVGPPYQGSYAELLEKQKESIKSEMEKLAEKKKATEPEYDIPKEVADEALSVWKKLIKKNQGKEWK